jgi:hypothetical protein
MAKPEAIALHLYWSRFHVQHIKTFQGLKQSGIVPLSKQFARTSISILLNPLMPSTGIISPPQKFLMKFVKPFFCEVYE